ncbi:MAG: DNA polymerase III subunit alpha [Endomicrobiaceae bacterium]|nr:DNA polymerase III subunit alpha [Endomicrobiaceae bacterium]
MSSEFIHLHNHTEYSLLDGAVRLTKDGRPAELFQLIKEYKMPALAITDHGNMYGAMEFYWACKDSGIKPIIGCEVYVAKKSRLDKTKETGGYHHLVLLAKDMQGYTNLMMLVSLGFTEGFYSKPRVDKELLEKYSKGLICLSGCIAGEVANLLLEGNIKEAEKSANFYKDTFGSDNFYLEIQDNGLEDQKKIIAPLIELSKTTMIPLVATNDCHYLKKEDAYYHDVLLCINTNKLVNDPDRMRFGSNLFYYRPPQEMIETFSYVPEAIKNTLVISDIIDLNIKTDQLLLPNYTVPEGFTPDTYLEKLCREGLVKRYGTVKKEHLERLEHELKIIKKMGFDSYFLIVWDFIKYAKDNNIPVGPGRGSGAGAIVAYVLGITDICPLRYNLLFERFLNPDRRSMPDLDIDFADFGRDRVIEYVRNKYGHNNCAQIITYGSMKSKMVVKDVARAMGFSPTEGQKIANAIPNGVSIGDAKINSEELQKIIKGDEKIAELIKIAGKLEGIKRHTGVHAAGMVIAPEDIRRFSPLAKGSKDIVTTQYDGNTLPKLGLLKVDFLGLKTLSIIDEAVKLIQLKNKKFDISKLDLDDGKTYQLLQEGKTYGVFQLESDGIKSLTKRLKPTNIDHIIALIALYRPGPMNAHMPDIFVDCKHGRKSISYDHPSQEPILKNTYGCIIYQEQVMQMAMVIGGFTPGEADGLRKAMGKKKPEEIQKQRAKFIEGAKKNKVSEQIANKIYDNMETFGGYGFNKSHSAAYGYVSYQTAFLKANYPLEFMTAMMNSEIGGAKAKEGEEKKLVSYIEDAKQFGIKVLPPDVQFSEGKFSIEGKNIRYGLIGIKNVGEGPANAISNARKEHKKFTSFDDFLSKVDLATVSKKTIESLAKAGAFDSFGKDKLQVRADILENMEELLSIVTKNRKNLDSNQGFLFEPEETFSKKNSSVQKKTEPLEESISLEYEKEVLDFYVSGHPLDKYKRDLIAFSQYRFDKIPMPTENNNLATAKIIRIAGMITSIRMLVTKEEKKKFASFVVADLHGDIECVMFPKTFDRLEKYLSEKNVIVVKGKLLNKQGKRQIVVEEIYTIDEAKKKYTPNLGCLHIHVSEILLDDELSEKIIDTLKKYPGKSKVFLDIKDYQNGDYLIETEYSVKYSDDCLKELENLLGEQSTSLQYNEV